MQSKLTQLVTGLRVVALSGLLFLFLASPLLPQKKEVCLTFDDFPYVQMGRYPVSLIKDKLTRLIKVLEKYDAKPAAFINEIQLYKDESTIDPRRVELVQMWIDAGFTMGNHGFRHVDLSFHTAEEFKEDVLNGEKIFAPMIKGKQKFYRFPQLEVGNTLEIKREVERFLEENNYKILPVTISAAEYKFAIAYSKAYYSKNEKYKKKIADDYIAYLSKFIDLVEKQTEFLFKRQIKHVMLLHMNELNIDHMERLILLFKKKKYKFISAEDAMTDEVFTIRNTYAGRDGLGFIDQIASMRRLMGDPLFDDKRVPVPDYVLELSDNDFYDFPYDNE
ncbi:MAG: polysaccharide deacetylase family protein [Ignavibacteriales bacterium]|nr:MAG: polysaccharide deacetylase family protein [Ignavibacteriales bacterium]